MNTKNNEKKMYESLKNRRKSFLDANMSDNGDYNSGIEAGFDSACEFFAKRVEFYKKYASQASLCMKEQKACWKEWINDLKKDKFLSWDEWLFGYCFRDIFG